MTQVDDLSDSWPTFKNCAHESVKKKKKNKTKTKQKQKTVRSSLLVTHHGIKNATLLINALLHTMQP